MRINLGKETKNIYRGFSTLLPLYLQINIFKINSTLQVTDMLGKRKFPNFSNCSNERMLSSIP